MPGNDMRTEASAGGRLLCAASLRPALMTWGARNSAAPCSRDTERAATSSARHAVSHRRRRRNWPDAATASAQEEIVIVLR
jgi:hypothetical protein